MIKAHVLIAEDERSIREMCIRSLTIEGYDVEGVPNGEAAIDYARENPVDVLITDLRMPGIGGLAACRAILKNDPSLAAIVMTGFGTMESAIEALKAGVSEFVLKPFRPDELLGAVDRALRRRRLERENARLNALIPLFDISRVFMSSVDLAEVPRHVVRVARKEMGAGSASLMLLDGQGHLSIHAAEGLPTEAFAAQEGGGQSVVAQYAVAHREPVIIQGDIREDPRFGGVSDQRLHATTSGISLPLVHKDKVLGVLNVSRGGDAPAFSESDVDLLSLLASQAGLAIDNARMFQQTEAAYQRLAELDHLKSEFISIASHELRAPLAILMAYATLLEVEATGEMREHLVQVLDSAMQLKSIIDEMVSLRRIDSRETQIETENVEIGPLAQGLIDDVATVAQQRQITICVNIPPGLARARADRQVLTLVLGNLLSNAVKFTPDGGVIEIVGSEDETHTKLSVADNGVGIPADRLDRVFDRFYQVEGSLRREHGGIGLGLAIAQEMADLVDAHITVESEVGQGSTFTVWLPRA